MITPPRRRTLVILAMALGGCVPPPAAFANPRPKAHPVAAVGYGNRKEVRAFIDELVRDEGFARASLRRWLGDARYQKTIVDAMQRPLLAPPKWYEYAPRFLSEERIGAGVEFWQAHEQALDRAEAEFGVPPEIVVAIIGVETFYGRNTGRYRVIDALATLAFDYPRRAPYFRNELREFLLFARDEKLSPLAPRGSFAGAMGLPQFMPGSLRRYAIDFDGDGRIDLWNSGDDVVGSVANYLARHDWIRGGPVWSKATVVPSQRDATLARLDGGISERRPLAAWSADGVAAKDAAGVAADPAMQQPVGLLLLEEQPDPQEGEAADPPEPARDSLWIVYPNFYVITRYNKSRLYAAAVASLAEELRAAHDANPPP
ncbi:MAG TPA: lytic murein transglycosylase B [Casimicrobiaceae bacterium]|nr:lytic murein transglycosylase B [Casimicrobiaceae bacterium]